MGTRRNDEQSSAMQGQSQHWAFVLKVSSGLALFAVAWIVHHLGTSYPLGELIFFRNVGMVSAVMAMALLKGDVETCWTTKRVSAHIIRGIIGTVALTFNFLSLSILPLAEAQALFYLAPLLVVALGSSFAGESGGWRLWLCSIIGLAGVSFILSRDFGAQSGSPPTLGIVFGCLGALFTAVAILHVRNLALTESSSAIAFSFGCVGLVLSLFSIGSGWRWPDPIDLGLLVLLGLAGAMGHILLAIALAQAPAGTLASLEYLNLLWALLVSTLVTGQLPSWLSLTGIGLIVIASAGLVIYPKSSRATSPTGTNSTTKLFKVEN